MVPTSPRRELEAQSAVAVIEAPEFPDFDHSEMEAAADEAVDIGALDLGALNLVLAPAPVPHRSEVTEFPRSPPPFLLCEPAEPLASSDVDSHLEPTPLPDPVNISELPEPPVSELWSQSEEASSDPPFNPRADEAERRAGEDITQPSSDSHPRWGFKAPVTREPWVEPLPLHRHSCCEAGDNVYEDVERVKKVIAGQNSRKRKAALKSTNVWVLFPAIPQPEFVGLTSVSFPSLTDPYADSHYSTVSLL